jgi:hypothetical protein
LPALKAKKLKKRSVAATDKFRISGHGWATAGLIFEDT